MQYRAYTIHVRNRLPIIYVHACACRPMIYGMVDARAYICARPPNTYKALHARTNIHTREFFPILHTPLETSKEQFANDVDFTPRQLEARPHYITEDSRLLKDAGHRKFRPKHLQSRCILYAARRGQSSAESEASPIICSV